MPPSPDLWPDRDLSDPHAVADKARRVRAMFAAIAPSYDLNNRLHSLWRDQAWRRAAVRLAALRPGEVVLDVACGTGDLSFAFAAGGAAQVLGVDFTPEMLLLAQSKAQRVARADWSPRKSARDPAPAAPGARADRSEAACPCHPSLAFAAGDALRLPLPDASVDVVSIAFGIRNVTDPAAALREFHRVLRPGGRVLILEFSLPRSRLLRGLYQFYFQRILPRTAALIARDRSGAYRYLPRSVSTFLPRQAMLDRLGQAGFASPRAHPLTLGIAVLYHAAKVSG